MAKKKETQGRLAVKCMEFRKKLKAHDSKERKRRADAKEERLKLKTALDKAEKEYEAEMLQDNLPGIPQT